jgi:hypothetical protein
MMVSEPGSMTPWPCARTATLAIALALALPPSARGQDFGLAGTVALATRLVDPRTARGDDAAPRPHSIWSAIRFTVREYPLIPFAELRRLGIGTIHPHLGRLRVVPGRGPELYDYYGNVILPDQTGEFTRMVRRLHGEGFRVVPWISMKKAKPDGSFWIHDDWRPVARVARFLINQLGVDGLQLDPEPLNVRDVPALNAGLSVLEPVLAGRELSIAVPKLVPGCDEKESGYQWPTLRPYHELTHANALYIMSYDTSLAEKTSYGELLRTNLQVAKALTGRKRVYLGMPSYPPEVVPAARRPRRRAGRRGLATAAAPSPANVRTSHSIPPEDGVTFAESVADHPDLAHLAGIAIYDLEEPEDRNWLASWQLAERGMARINAVLGIGTRRSRREPPDETPLRAHRPAPLAAARSPVHDWDVTDFREPRERSERPSGTASRRQKTSKYR